MPSLSAQIERITYSNDENGYTVAQVRVKGRSDLLTIVGNLPAVVPGEVLAMEGVWLNHPKYGEQFSVERYRTVMPATAAAIEKYLGSGLIKGIGPVMAKRIVAAFGVETLEVIDADPARLMAVQGIGASRLAMIRKAWSDQKQVREVMIFLQSHGVSATYAARIFKQYGDQAVAAVQENPYRLAEDIYGIGFITADKIAGALGIAKDSLIRAAAGIRYTLSRLTEKGHVFSPRGEIIRACQELLSIDLKLVEEALSLAALENKIVLEPPLADQEGDIAVYLSEFHHCENKVAENIRRLMRCHGPQFPMDTVNALSWVQECLAIQLARDQLSAVAGTISYKLLIITGGPGTGKTTIIKAVAALWKQAGARVLLAAPTGRAAKRMAEATRNEAKTLHRLLEYSFAKGGFQKNERSPLSCDVLIVDEASMIEMVLMHHLLKAVPSEVCLVLVGDVNQLPSVGPGNVLRDIIDSGRVPVFQLTEIFRQAKRSKIVVNAHRINDGRMPYLAEQGEKTDFYFREREDPESALSYIVELVRDHLPSRRGFHPMDDIQVITPMNRGVVGAMNLNIALQAALNPMGKSISRGSRILREGDKVMQVKNNYDKGVYNGDIGRISRIQLEVQELVVRFDGRPVTYDFTELDEIVLAYAISVHKSQGSEYPVVIVPILIQHYLLLQRNLIYTAVTRGKRLVIIVGTQKALAIGIRNNNTLLRHTRLKERLAAF